MNTEAMLQLADTIECVEPESFEMGDWYVPVSRNVCGYAACVAGWAVLSDDTERTIYEAWKKTDPENGYDCYAWGSRGALVLGLTMHQADQLFTCAGHWATWLNELGIDHEVECLDDVTSKHAVEVLRGLARGELIFSVKSGCCG